MQQTDIEELLEKFIKGQISEEEEMLLQQWYQSVEHGEVVIPVDSTDEKDQVFRRLQAALANHVHGSKVVPIERNKKNWYKWIAAACVLLFISGSVWYFVSGKLRNHQPAIAKQLDLADTANILPGNTKATLTLSDGSAIVLDNEQSGMLANEGNTSVIKQQDGSIVYNANNAATGKIQFNTISIPRGGQYQVTLPDGTKVWLNAASSLTFPTAFAGNERIVQLKGEAYFEVAKNAGQPFIVEAGQTQVRVLGTHFNVMAYTDEGNIKTTLLEGSVKVSEGNESAMLRPGQQGISNTGGKKLSVIPVDVNAAIAWKEGYYFFDKTEVEIVMRQIARWYDVEVEYENAVPKDLIVGKIPRSANLKDVLHVMELIGLRFKITGRKVTVLNN